MFNNNKKVKQGQQVSSTSVSLLNIDNNLLFYFLFLNVFCLYAAWPTLARKVLVLVAIYEVGLILSTCKMTETISIPVNYLNMTFI